MTASASSGYRKTLDQVGFALFLLGEVWWVLTYWDLLGPQAVPDRVEMLRITLQVAGATAALLAGRLWLFAQEVIGLFFPWAGLVVVAIEGFRRCLWLVR